MSLHTSAEAVCRLRVHETQEWHNLYQKSAIDDLHRFLDRYLKEIENGWETTPRVRGCMLTYTGLAVTDFSRRGLPGPTYRLSTIPSRR